MIVSYKIDPKDRLVWVNDAWSAFAAENDGKGLSGPEVSDKVLWDYIADENTCHLYRVMIRKVRDEAATLTVRLHCDSPDVERIIDLTARPDGENVRFDCKILSEKPRPRAAILDAKMPRTRDRLRMCSWCCRIDVTGQWTEMLEAIAKLGLFDQPRVPEINHSICADCYKTAMDAIEPRR